jgi:hypothetical protein
MDTNSFFDFMKSLKMYDLTQRLSIHTTTLAKLYAIGDSVF